ncbi:uncharacterized protein BP01DRAFT_322246 [Aspergillus saccharolyticus JOP 1030-1]|uniref:Rhodopsin domain-containing protein n=1 Tax=Aspergillus saccharolyticus JOP 1030-1 TaxID=1450539 RepID=A0A318ZC72_9EURO|nr:hypothetical protein BP01DRAFT_322246 [Aspergillus saccharolyticus JOP 1030-1]PYH43914.1 hypothetical protein BP01DRAFT_322246 [Aspergillus saccharolyticus JOP 1030-1]
MSLAASSSSTGMAAMVTAALLPPPAEINNTHKVYSVAVGCIILGIIAAFVVLARLFQRWRTGAFGADDYCIMPGLVLYLGWTTMAAYVNLHAGVGKPLWEITLAEYTIWYQGIVGSAFLYPAMSATIRSSVILLYRRTFAASYPGMLLAIWTLLGCQMIYVIVFTVIEGFICTPFSAAWTNPLLREQHCNDWRYYYIQVALFSCSMSFDAILLVLPIYPVSKLQMPLQKRIGVGAVLILGAAASIAAAYKLGVFVDQMNRIDSINPYWLQYAMSRVTPPQFDKYGLTFWIPSQVEPCVGLIGASLPALRGLIVDRFKQLSSAVYFSRKGLVSSDPPYEAHPSGQFRRGDTTAVKSGGSGGRDDAVLLRSEYVELADRV